MQNKKIRLLIQTSIGVAFYLLLLLGIWHSEKSNPDGSIQSFFDAFWYSIVTLTTVGYGAYYPVTTTGKIFGLVLIILSLGLLGFIISNLTNKIREYMEKQKLGQFGTKEQGHVIIVGWNSFGKLFTDQIVQANHKVAIVSDDKDDIDLIKEIYSTGVFCMFADLKNYEMLEKINIQQSSSVFINIPEDSDSLVYLLNIKKVFPGINCVVSLENAELKETFYTAGATYVVSEKEISSRLLASFVFEPDVAYLTEDLITTSSSDDHSDILELEVTSKNRYAGLDYLDVFIDVKKRLNCVLLGISREINGTYTLIKNPSGGQLIEVGDYLIAVCDGKSKNEIINEFNVEEGRIDKKAFL